MMKFSVFLLVSCCVVQLYAIPPQIKAKLPAEVIELIYSLRKICAPKFGLTDADIESYVITNSDEKYRCYMECMMLEAKWMDPDHTIHYERIIETSHNEIRPVLEAAFAKCRDIEASSETCGKPYNFHVCLAKAVPTYYFLP